MRSADGKRDSWYALDLAVKRVLDIVLSAGALIVLGLPILAVALAVRIVLGSPVLFRQQRAGLGGKTFDLFKFRSMAPPTEGKSDDASRLGAFGKMLRKTSLDELPSLWNILKGEMSIVGPRPLFAYYLPHYGAIHGRRHEVRPGLTGWAQVNGRNQLTWEQRFDLDVWYVDNRSLWLDLKIILKTIGVVFTGRGVNSDTHLTMEPFVGTDGKQLAQGSRARPSD